MNWNRTQVECGIVRKKGRTLYIDLVVSFSTIALFFVFVFYLDEK